MTKQEQQIAIAEACGWTRMHQPISGIDNLHGIFPNGNTSVYIPVPNYLNNLNAMHEAEKLHPNQYAYAEELFALTGGIYGPDDEIESSNAMFNVIHATASQRAEAFLRTIGKWKD